MKLNMHVAGVSYRCTPEDIKAMQFDDVLAVEREPRNAHDPNAIKLMRGDKHIGYVPAVHSARLAPLLDAGASCTARIDYVNVQNRLVAITVVVDEHNDL